MLYGTSSTSAVAALAASARAAALKHPAIQGGGRRFWSCQHDLRSSRWNASIPSPSTSSSSSASNSSRRTPSRGTAREVIVSRQLSYCSKGRSPVSRWEATTPTIGNAKAGKRFTGPAIILHRNAAITWSREASTVASSPEGPSSGPTISIPPEGSNNNTINAHSSKHSHERARSNKIKKPKRRYWLLSIAAAFALAGIIGWNFVPPVRRFFIAIKRCALVAVAVGRCIIDYKVLFRKEWDDPLVRHNDYKACHSTYGTGSPKDRRKRRNVLVADAVFHLQSVARRGFCMYFRRTEVYISSLASI